MKLLLPACLSLVVAMGPAAAQPVWRCGADGRLFSDRPCADGRVFAAGDPRSSEEVDAARQIAGREQKLAETLASERAERARVAPGAGLIAIGPLEAELQADRRAREIKRPRTSKRQPAKRHPTWSGAGI